MVKTPIKQRRLTKPKNYRFYDYQEHWLAGLAEQQGHGEKSVALRKLIDEAMFGAKRKAS